MIEKLIKIIHIEKAIKEIDRVGIPRNRVSRKFNLSFEGNLYPPKFVLSIASKIASGKEMEASQFGGGTETNSFFIKLGFEIIEGASSIGLKKTKNIQAKSKPTTSIKIIPKNKPTKLKPTNDPATPLKRESVKTAIINSQNIKISTVIIQSNSIYQNKSRDILIEKTIKLCKKDIDVLIFPAGTYEYSTISKNILAEVEHKIKNMLIKYDQNIIVCLGIDADRGNSQIGIAISKDGIIAVGRKFFPTVEEKSKLIKAKSANEKEFGYQRTFDVKKKKFFLAVCYDVFGIKKNKLKNDNVYAVIDFIHGFNPFGKEGSGEVYFVKHGLVGAAKEWSCPAFGAVVFFNREIPPNWPSGVIWNKGNVSTQKWKYSDNPLNVQNVLAYDLGNEKIEMRTYSI
jgi:hypothetical protein